MTHLDTNPYAPPVSADSSCGITDSSLSNGSISLTIASAFGTLALIAFAIILLQSTPNDRKAGWMFLANAPVIASLSIAAMRSRRWAAIFGTIATCLQLLIMIAMIGISIGDAPTIVAVNAVIIGPCIAISSWAWWSSRTFTLSLQSDHVV